MRRWCIQENWNLGTHDANFYFSMDSEGHSLLLREGIPIDAISLIKHSPCLFTIGPFIVERNYRNKGYGKGLWNLAMERLKDYEKASIFLYAVPRQSKR